MYTSNMDNSNSVNMPPRSGNVEARSQTRTSRSSASNRSLHRTLRSQSPSSAISRRQKNRSSSGT